jgi:hypothetical protein
VFVARIVTEPATRVENIYPFVLKAIGGRPKPTLWVAPHSLQRKKNKCTEAMCSKHVVKPACVRRTITIGCAGNGSGGIDVSLAALICGLLGHSHVYVWQGRVDVDKGVYHAACMKGG